MFARVFRSTCLFLATTNLFIAYKLNISGDDYMDVTRQLIQRNGRDSRRRLRGDRRLSWWNLRVPAMVMMDDVNLVVFEPESDALQWPC